MKLQDQIKAIAELDGLIYDSTCNVTGGLMFKHAPQRTRYCPDYLTSRDAIVSVIEKQPPKVLHQMYKHLCDWFDGESPENWIKATPSQLCEALLRATGKWIE